MESGCKRALAIQEFSFSFLWQKPPLGFADNILYTCTHKLALFFYLFLLFFALLEKRKRECNTERRRTGNTYGRSVN